MEREKVGASPSYEKIGPYRNVIRFRSVRDEFRLPELDSLAHLFGVEIKYDAEQAKIVSSKSRKNQSPFLKADLPSDEMVRKIAERSVTVMSFYELVADGKDFDELVQSLKHVDATKYCDGKSFKFIIDCYGKRYSLKEQTQMFHKFKELRLWETCPLNLKDPERTFCVLLDYGNEREKEREGGEDHLRRAYLAVKIVDGNTELIDKYDVKKRQYIGTTSMDSELALIVANQALARSGAFIIDPFVGTGSLVLTCAHFGAVTIGGDIDPRVLRGVGKPGDVKSNFVQHGLINRFLGVIVCDSSRPIWREAPIFDAIVADPPYGIRAGARKVGKKKKSIEKAMKANNPGYAKEGHIPQCVGYEVEDVLSDLLDFAAKRLTVGGRLVYWLPSTDQYTEDDLPLHPCLKIIANSEQPLTMRWRRRLVTMVKTMNYDKEMVKNAPPTAFGQLQAANLRNIPAYWKRKEDGEEGTTAENNGQA
eukprot:TRINITY_DN6577_c0_g1_i1.p1 TRINITY_DN6577_c0_g1~~TRINITY_DN6577_c0_g1_i1.p1  ORF type:complete len:478 (-),score=111.26 TRINITY_DN6577_c0_g1_i1:13-1446(-)